MDRKDRHWTLRAPSRDRSEPRLPRDRDTGHDEETRTSRRPGLLADGGILAAGTRTLSNEQSVVLLQLSPDGVLSGARTAGGRGSWTGFGATLLGDGKVLVAGRGFSAVGGTDYGLVRFAR